MPSPRMRMSGGVPVELVDRLAALRAELGIAETFPDDVLAEAKALAENPPTFDDHLDRSDIPLVTIDPASSMDLDQAVHVQTHPQGYLVYYAIADLGAWVAPGGAIDTETHRRGQTYYAPNTRCSLHPKDLSEQAASLLADGRPRPAMLWELTLDHSGELIHTGLSRAMVVSRPGPPAVHSNSPNCYCGSHLLLDPSCSSP